MRVSVPSIRALLQSKQRTLMSGSLSVVCLALMYPLTVMAQSTPIFNSGALSPVTAWLFIALLCAMFAFAADAMIHSDPTEAVHEAFSIRNGVAWFAVASVAIAIIALTISAPAVFAAC